MQREKQRAGSGPSAQKTAGKPAHTAYFDQWRNGYRVVHGLGQNHCAVRHFDHSGVRHHRLFRLLHHGGHAQSTFKLPGGKVTAALSQLFLIFVLCLLALEPDTRTVLVRAARAQWQKLTQGDRACARSVSARRHCLLQRCFPRSNCGLPSDLEAIA